MPVRLRTSRGTRAAGRTTALGHRDRCSGCSRERTRRSWPRPQGTPLYKHFPAGVTEHVGEETGQAPAQPLSEKRADSEDGVYRLDRSLIRLIAASATPG